MFPATRSLVVSAHVVVLLAGCGSNGDDLGSAVQDASSASEDVILLRGDASQLSAETQDNIDRKDPALDQWPSEVLHDRAKAKLAPFLELVCGAAPWDRGKLASVLADPFRGASTLRPDDLRVVHEDGSARVSRPASGDHALRQPEELQALCAALRAPFEGAKCRWFSKITRVDLEDAQRFHTSVIVHTDG